MQAIGLRDVLEGKVSLDDWERASIDHTVSLDDWERASIDHTERTSAAGVAFGEYCFMGKVPKSLSVAE
jgi:hypothetical protein